MNKVTHLVRDEIRSLAPYVPAKFEPGLTRLNANETPWSPDVGQGDMALALNRYPEARPDALAARLADIYGVRADEILVTRGSTEAIDLLIRCVCRPGQDNIVICPPTFGMYEVYAQIQGAGIRRVPLLADRGYGLDMPALVNDWSDEDRLFFICSPNNPTGQRIPTDQIVALCDALAGRALVVIDAAYVEFASADPTLELLRGFDNVCVLRSMSKAWGLASTRCGTLLANSELLGLLSRAQAPYVFPGICEAAVQAALDAADSDRPPHADEIVDQRETLARRLGALACVRHVWPSEANFLLTEVTSPEAVMAAAQSAGLLLRYFPGETGLENSLRITVGTAEQNDTLVSALGDIQ